MESDSSELWEKELSVYLSTQPQLLESQSKWLALQGSDLCESCPKLLSSLFTNPISTLEKCDALLSKITHGKKNSFGISSMPNVPELVRSSIPKNDDVGYLISLKGTVVKTGSPKVIPNIKKIKCKSCQFEKNLIADIETFYSFKNPEFCQNCSFRSFQNSSKKNEETEECFDVQEIKIQEQVGSLKLGSVPRSIIVLLERHLVDSVKPGDDVLVIGVVRRRWHGLGKGYEGRTNIELILHANYISVKNDAKESVFIHPEEMKDFENYWFSHREIPLVGRDTILKSFCPQVYGLYYIKLAMAVILAGGVERIDSSGTRVRGESHLLMVGDPGTGKSQILKYASKLSSRSVLTTGIGSTSAGLTASASRNSGEWQLEAGALVLADGGICCIDEFNSIRENDRTCIHEAMEQQTLSVAKAGLVCKLQTRCSVIAAANPKGSYDPESPTSVNIAVASPLLSRFDLVFILLDTKNPQWDEIVSSHVLQGVSFSEEAKSLWGSFDKVRSYFTYIKKYNPSLGPESSELISYYYQWRRSIDDSNGPRVTVRVLQSLIRLSQGHARLMCHDKVEMIDAMNAIILHEISMESPHTLLKSISNPLHDSFPSDPENNYKEQSKEILTALKPLKFRESKEKELHETFGVRSQRNDDEETSNDILSQVLYKIKNEKSSFHYNNEKNLKKKRGKDEESEEKENGKEDMKLSKKVKKENEKSSSLYNDENIKRKLREEKKEMEEKEKKGEKEKKEGELEEMEKNRLSKIEISKPQKKSSTMEKLKVFAAPSDESAETVSVVPTLESIFSAFQEDNLDLEL